MMKYQTPGNLKKEELHSGSWGEGRQCVVVGRHSRRIK